MGYAEAIEQQVQLRSWYGSVEGKRGLALAAAQRGQINPEMLRAGSQRISVALHLGSPFWVGAHIGKLVVAGETSFPDDAVLTFRDLPEPHGFVWFEEALPLPVRDDGAVRPLQALSWSSYAVFDDQEFVPLNTDGAGDEGVQIVAYASVPNESHPLVIGTQNIVFGRPIIVEIGGNSNPVMRARFKMIMRYFFVLTRFLSQRVLVTGRHRVMNRGLRRRIARTIEHVPDVHVVELRRREYQQHDESQGGSVEYSCQWLVRGHWHQYHTKEGLQPRWVAPYVKGPSDKPLRVAAQTAYEVVR